MIRKLSDFIVNKRIAILVVMLILAAVCIVSSRFVVINEDMTKYKNEIVAGIKKTYNGKLDDGTTVNVDVDIDVLSKDEIPNPFTTRHEINIVDKLTDNSHSGESVIGGGAMDVRLDICKGYYPDNPLSRTAAHEFGHLLGLDHVDDESNVMDPFSKGRIITGSQISESYTHYKRGQLNQNIPYIKIREERRRKAMKVPK